MRIRKHRKKFIAVSLIVILVALILIPMFLQSQKTTSPKQVNLFPPNIMMELAPKSMQRLVGACNETSTDVVARQNINSTTVYWFPSLCNVPTGWQEWVPSVQAWSIIKRLEVA